MLYFKETNSWADKTGEVLRGTGKETKVTPPRIEMVAEYAFDSDRTLRGLMALCDLPKEEIEAKIQQRHKEQGTVQAGERAN